MEKLGKNYWLLLSGYTVSTFGTYLSLVVINLFIYQVTGSALFVGIFMLLRLVPAFFMGNIAGVLADKYDRRHLIIIADLIRAVLMLSMIFLREDVFPIYFIIFGIAICDRLYVSCLGGSLPNISGPGNIVKANSYLSSGRTIALIAGPMLGGLLTSFKSYNVAFCIDAATYLVSATSVFLITANFQSATTIRRAMGIWKGLKEGYGFIFAHAGLLSVIIIRALDAFGSSALNVGAPIFASASTSLSPGYCYGLIYASFGAGEMIGAFFLARSKSIQSREPEQVVGVSILLMALFFAVAFSVPWLFLTMACLAVSGMAEGVTTVTYNLFLQRNPDEIRGRIVGTSETTVWTAMGIGMFLSGILADKAPISQVVWIFATVIIVGSIVHLATWQRRKHGIETNTCLTNETADI